MIVLYLIVIFIFMLINPLISIALILLWIVYALSQRR
jgi:hypothetical protein